jgi:hypothetical protein
MDMDRQADEAWILSVQSKLYQWSQANPGDQWRDMWGWLNASWRSAASWILLSPKFNSISAVAARRSSHSPASLESPVGCNALVSP